MRIDGITTCVGAEYAGYLAEALPVWMKTLDSVTIVTSHNGVCDMAFQPIPLSLVRTTDAFATDARQFNKGAALNYGIRFVQSCTVGRDWILAFDCDIIPPLDWRIIAEQQIQRGNLYTAKRYDQQGKQLDRRFYPRGYFQLWHASDPHYRREPIFDDHHKHAGRYDTAFANQWPQANWHDLGLKLTHQGQKSKNWFGPGTTAEQMRGAQREARQPA